MTKTTRARCTLEFRQEMVRLVAGGQSQASIAKTLGRSVSVRRPGRPTRGETRPEGI
jgi:transposase